MNSLYFPIFQSGDTLHSHGLTVTIQNQFVKTRFVNNVFTENRSSLSRLACHNEFITHPLAKQKYRCWSPFLFQTYEIIGRNDPLWTSGFVIFPPIYRLYNYICSARIKSLSSVKYALSRFSNVIFFKKKTVKTKAKKAFFGCVGLKLLDLFQLFHFYLEL